jgi:hypothetical protein
MVQLNLFAQTVRQETLPCPEPPARHESSTSIAAAEKIKPDANTQRALVLSYLRGRGSTGATREEICTALGMSGDSIRPRVWELMRAKPVPLVVETPATRRTQSGREAFILCAAGCEQEE